ncbi:hypothetical protein Nepgr_002197 [Nepenthes gracilis]|uniref:Protein kinase domain-containing protein n=1 Tax=Nepenthes gracilis TaxID=150966 RepID=A0AAD3P6I4_NEPGR|nr:hypothetical protein Nepgr_002197 [Nepenthes gracilis]
MPSLPCSIFFNFIIILNLFSELPISHSLQKTQQQQNQQPNTSLLLDHQCNQTCGGLQIPFPFHVTKYSSSSSSSSCEWSSESILEPFQLSCFNSTILFLNINSENYRILEFFPDGILVDFPGFSSTCHPYNDLNSFGFAGNRFFGISSDNVVGLYDCEDSSLCKANCEISVLPSCNGNGNDPSCCYPLSDHSIWHVGDEFSVFSEFNCRGFSSWIVPRGTRLGRRGVKLEWAFPMNLSESVCAANLHTVNATSVSHGIRCACDDGFAGDGFTKGIGCLKSCIKDGQEDYDKDGQTKRHNETKTIVAAGILASAFAAASLLAILCMVRWFSSQGSNNPQGVHYHRASSFHKACRTRLFSQNELEQAAKRFTEGQKLAEISSGLVCAGILKNGTHIVLQKIDCENERDLVQVLTRVEILSAVSHCHMAQILGCCINFRCAPMVVHECPENGMLEEHLHQAEGHKIGLDWQKRLRIAAQTASVLCIFLDREYSAKIACFGLLNSTNVVDSAGAFSCNVTGSDFYRNDVYDFGVMLLEIISGSKHLDMVPTALQNIRDGKMEEIVDPMLYYHEQLPLGREQMERVANIAVRCLSFGGDGKMGMVDVARELMHIMKESAGGGGGRPWALQETFSNSSLLQMISMSPDSINVP